MEQQIINVIIFVYLMLGFLPIVGDMIDEVRTNKKGDAHGR